MATIARILRSRPEPLPGALRPSGWRLLTALVAAAVAAAAVGSAVAALARAVAPQWSADLDRLAPLVIASVYAAVIAALLAVLGRSRSDRRRYLALNRPTRGGVLLGAAAWAAAYVVAAAYYGVSEPLGGSGIGDAGQLLLSVGADNGRLDAAGPILATLVLVRILLLSPVAEELLFRGALFTWLRSRLPARWTILVTGVLFGLMHQAPAFLPLAILVGFAAGWIRERTGTVAVPIMIHSVQSAAVVLVSLIMTGWDTPALLG